MSGLLLDCDLDAERLPAALVVLEVSEGALRELRREGASLTTDEVLLSSTTSVFFFFAGFFFLFLTALQRPPRLAASPTTSGKVSVMSASGQSAIELKQSMLSATVERATESCEQSISKQGKSVAQSLMEVIWSSQLGFACFPSLDAGSSFGAGEVSISSCRGSSTSSVLSVLSSVAGSSEHPGAAVSALVVHIGCADDGSWLLGTGELQELAVAPTLVLTFQGSSSSESLTISAHLRREDLESNRLTSSFSSELGASFATSDFELWSPRSPWGLAAVLCCSEAAESAAVAV